MKYCIDPNTISHEHTGGGVWVTMAECSIYDGPVMTRNNMESYWLCYGSDTFSVHKNKPWSDTWDETDEIAHYFTEYDTDLQMWIHDFGKWEKPGSALVKLHNFFDCILCGEM